LKRKLWRHVDTALQRLIRLTKNSATLSQGRDVSAQELGEQRRSDAITRSLRRGSLALFRGDVDVEPQRH
jgi:hypothetical protein